MSRKRHRILVYILAIYRVEINLSNIPRLVSTTIHYIHFPSLLVPAIFLCVYSYIYTYPFTWKYSPMKILQHWVSIRLDDPAFAKDSKISSFRKFFAKSSVNFEFFNPPKKERRSLEEGVAAQQKKRLLWRFSIRKWIRLKWNKIRGELFDFIFHEHGFHDLCSAVRWIIIYLRLDSERMGGGRSQVCEENFSGLKFGYA